MKISFQISSKPFCQEKAKPYLEQFVSYSPEEAEVIVAIGGDGFLLQTLHQHHSLTLPIYGIQAGTVGFLMNETTPETLLARLEQAKPATLYPLKAKCWTRQGGREGGEEETVEVRAFNEISLFRHSPQAAKIHIEIDGVVRMEGLICDGILLATPAGSTAYNLSVNGPILPIGSPLLALTPISPFRPRRWKGALLPHHSSVQFTVEDPIKRAVHLAADGAFIPYIAHVSIAQDFSRHSTLLFDPDHHLEERILKEQFLGV